MSADKQAQVEKPKGGKKLLIIIAVGVLVLVLVVGGLLMFLLRGNSDESHAEPETSKEESKKKEKKKKKKDENAVPIFEKLETFTVSLAGGESMLQLELHVELEDAHLKDTLKAYMPKVRNDVILLLSSRKLDDLRSDNGAKKLIEDLQTTINHAMDVDEDEGVKSVAISSMIIQ